MKLRDDEIQVFAVGSRLHGTAMEDSDTDQLSVSIPPLRDILGGRTNVATIRVDSDIGRNLSPNEMSTKTTVERTIVPLHKFVEGTMLVWGSYTDALFAPAAWIEGADVVGEFRELALRSGLPSKRLVSWVGSFAKTVSHLVRGLVPGEIDRRNMKSCSVVVTRLISLRELIETGSIEFPLKRADRILEIKNMRSFGTGEFEELASEIDELDRSVEALAVGLPDEPDLDAIRGFAERVYILDSRNGLG